MSSSVGELIATLRLDASAFAGGVKEAEARLGALKEGAQDAARGLGVVTAALVAAGVGAIKAASDWAEQTNVMSQAFGKNTAAAEAWASSSGEAMGRSTQQMRTFAGTFQSMLAPMTGSVDKAAQMSMAFSQLAVDIGSFRNVSDQEAFTALSSALTGEIEPMRKYGVVMTEAALQEFAHKKGLDAKVQSMTEAQKTELRYQFILANTGIMQGDAVRTADGLANQMKALQGTVANAAKAMGDELLPTATSMVGTLKDMVKGITDADPETKKYIVTAGLFAAAVGGITAAFFAATAAAGAFMIAAGVAAPVMIAVAAAVAGIAVLANYATGASDPTTPAQGKRKSFDDMIEIARKRNELRDREPVGAAVVASDGIPLIKPKQKVTFSDADAKTNDKVAKDRAAKESERFTRTQAMLDEYSAKTLAAYWKNQAEQERDGAANLAEARAATDKVDAEERKFAEDSLADDVAAKKKIRDETDKLDAEQLDWEAKRHAAAMAQDQRAGAVALGGIQQLLGGDLMGAASSAISLLPKNMAAQGGILMGVVDGIVGLFKMAAENIGKVFEIFAKPFGPNDPRTSKAMSSGVTAASASVTSSPVIGVILAPLAFALGTMASLITETKSFAKYQAALSKGIDRVVQALEPAFQQLLPLAGLFIQLSTSVALMIGSLIPGPMVASALFNVFKGLAVAGAWMAVGLENMKLGLLAMNAAFFEAANTITGGKNATIKKAAGETGGALDRAVRDSNRDELIANAHTIMGMTELGATALATSETLDKLNRSVTNMPAGYRVDVSAARAQDANPSRGGGGGGAPAAGGGGGPMMRPGGAGGGGHGAGGGANGGGGGGQALWDAAARNMAEAASRLISVREYVSTGQKRRPSQYAHQT